jgi:RNA polymerase sigma-70 factor (ECF subfamily)
MACNEATFEDLIDRVRQGDQAAAAELVKRYEPAIRRTIRFRLANSGLAPILDSMDISQSVLGNFFVRAAAGEFDLGNAEQLLKLLTRMARNKLISKARQYQAARRDQRRVEQSPTVVYELADGNETPSDQVAAKELFREAYKRLTPEEQRLVDLRGQGKEWSDIAEQLSGDPVLLRKRLSRAMDRVARELGLEATPNA